MRDRTASDDIVQGAYNRALLDLILPPMRRIAKDFGYAITVHGSLNRDIDLVAIPWCEHDVAAPEVLVMKLCPAIAGVTGRCNWMRGTETMVDFTPKPHGRVAATLLVWCGEDSANLDLSIKPTLPAPEEEDEA